jgi:hypothetical protein
MEIIFLSASAEIIYTHYIDLWIHLNMVAPSLSIELFTVKEKFITRNYLKITSRMIQCRGRFINSQIIILIFY